MARELTGDDDVYLRNGSINELAPNNSFWWHRDSEMVYTEFMHYFSGASVENGCLRVIPGSHMGSADELKEQAERRRRDQEYPEEYWVEGLADVELPGEFHSRFGRINLLSVVRGSTTRPGSIPRRTVRLMSHWLFRDGALVTITGFTSKMC